MIPIIVFAGAWLFGAVVAAAFNSLTARIWFDI